MKFEGSAVLPLAKVDGGQGQLLGSCFPVASRLLATAMHVVGPSDAGLVALTPSISSPQDYQDTTVNSSEYMSVKIVAADPIRDICILEFSNQSNFNLDYDLTGTDIISPGAEVAVYGYPHMDFGRRVVTVQRTHVGAKVLIPNNGVKSKHIVVNTQFRPGQSGGPVFDVQTGTVCAMVTGSYLPTFEGGGGSIIISGVDPNTLHQTGHAISAEYIKEMLP
ncbi:serine protease [Streptomyces sp. NPDC056341]|uniref:S1 family peptidase n=1 Tax=Streptomyces sp. NPDC056341 TaxID=3345788 RepID=UPI0035E36103